MLPSLLDFKPKSEKKKSKNTIHEDSLRKFLMYRGINPKELIKKGEIYDKIDKEYILLRISYIEEGIHIKDCVVYTNKLLKCITVDSEDEKILTEKQYSDLLNWLIIIEANNDIHCCTDGEPGRYTILTLQNNFSYHLYGSCYCNESLKSAYNIRDLIISLF